MLAVWCLALAQAAPPAGGAAAAAPGVPDAGLQFAPGRVLVRLNAQKVAGPAAAAAGGAAKVSVAQAHAALGAGLSLLRLVGRDAGLAVAAPPSGGAGTAAAAAAGAALLPADALMVLQITDGSSVEAKVLQLKRNPGAAAYRTGGGVYGKLCPPPTRLPACRRLLRQAAAGLTRCRPRRNPPGPAAVALAQPEYIYHLQGGQPSAGGQAAPNDAMYGAAARTSGLWFLPRIQAPAAWETTAGSKGVGICM